MCVWAKVGVPEANYVFAGVLLRRWHWVLASFAVLAESYTNEYGLTGNVSEGELIGEAT